MVPGFAERERRALGEARRDWLAVRQGPSAGADHKFAGFARSRSSLPAGATSRRRSHETIGGVLVSLFGGRSFSVEAQRTRRGTGEALPKAGLELPGHGDREVRGCTNAG
jgi:hypothetical protein